MGVQFLERPDFKPIYELRLAQKGFLCCCDLAATMVALMDSCAEQLSAQVHYDFGMRSIAAVIDAVTLDVTISEHLCLAKGLAKAAYPRLLKADRDIFIRLLQEHFGADPVQE